MIGALLDCEVVAAVTFILVLRFSIDAFCEPFRDGILVFIISGISIVTIAPSSWSDNVFRPSASLPDVGRVDDSDG
jgi:hypothetical protein